MSAKKENENEKGIPFYEVLAEARSLQIKKSKKEPNIEVREVNEAFYSG